MFEVPVVVTKRNNSIYIYHKYRNDYVLIIRDDKIINFDTDLDSFDLLQFNDEGRKIYQILLMEALCLKS
jgi:hypothetical protein